MEPESSNIDQFVPTVAARAEQSSRVFEVSGTVFASSLRSEIQERPEMTLGTGKAVKAALEAMQRLLRSRVIPVAIVDGKIRVNEKAMIPLHGYDVRLGDATFQFVKQANGTVVMYEVVDGR